MQLLDVNPPRRGAEERDLALDYEGYLLAEQTGSALDGPGLRTVFWLSGCQFRCTYCHNPDSWSRSAGRRVTLAELLREVAKYEHFMRGANGGVTLSGGEPLVQAQFCVELIRRVHALGVHTALDTNGFLGMRLSDADLSVIDLVLLDLKSFDAATHVRVTGHDPAPAQQFARRLGTLKRPTWIRFVLVPGLTDAPQNIAGLAGFCATLGCVERVEVLPFHQLGRHKWRDLGRNYELECTEPPSAASLAAARAVFRDAGLFCPD